MRIPEDHGRARLAIVIKKKSALEMVPSNPLFAGALHTISFSSGRKEAVIPLNHPEVGSERGSVHDIDFLDEPTATCTRGNSRRAARRPVLDHAAEPTYFPPQTPCTSFCSDESQAADGRNNSGISVDDVVMSGSSALACHW